MCPAIYDYNWVQNLTSPQGVEQQFGTQFHDSTKVFFDRVVDQELEKCKDAREAFDYFLHTFKFEHPVVGKWFQNFLIFEANRWGYLKVAAKEPLKFWRPVAYEMSLLSKPVGFMMHVDRIDRLSDGNLINIEYKAEKYINMSSLRGELNFYNYGINASGKYTEQVTMIGYYNPLLHRQFSEQLKPRSVQYMLRQVTLCRRGIASGVFTPRPQRFCRYCSHNFRCLARGVFDADFIA